MPSLDSRLDTVLSRMSLHLPFIAAIAMSMRVIIEKCGTACTNSVWVKFDPDFCEKLDDHELAYLYAHETMHKARMHPWRRGMRDPSIWGQACDHVINLELNDMKSSVMRMPRSGGLADRRFRGMSEEQVYDILLSEPHDEEYTTDIMEDSGRTEADMEIEVINIAKSCQMAGMKSGILDHILKTAGKSQVAWQDVLRSFVTSTIRSGSTWRRRARRSDAAGVYLPSLRSKTMGSMVVFGDVSGSMVPLLQKVVNEMQGIVDDVSPEFTHVICGDTRVSYVETFGRGSKLELRCQGGGGTDFRPLFNEVDARGWEPDCAVFLTDTYGTFPDAAPSYPVIWGVLGTSREVTVPWGEIVRVDR